MGATNSELITNPNARTGWHYIMIKAQTAYSDLNVRFRFWSELFNGNLLNVFPRDGAQGSTRIFRFWVPQGRDLLRVQTGGVSGDATEHTHRPALKNLLESVDADIVATNEPRRIACGAPDFNITRNGVPVGHIETKDIGVNLDEMERGKGPNGARLPPPSPSTSTPTATSWTFPAGGVRI